MFGAIRAGRGTRTQCRGWRQEAILRMLQNNLENAEKPEELIIYGGSGKAARDWKCYDAIVKTLKELEGDETLLVQSGKPVGVFKTTAISPRVLIANSNLVGHWNNWDCFNELDRIGLMMYGQMTAGGWSYIGTQGIIQGTYGTFAACARLNFDGTLKGRLVLTGGLGGMGGAQPLAATMNGAAALVIEVDPTRIKRRVERKFCDMMVEDLDEALSIVQDAKRSQKAISVGLLGNCAEVEPEMVKRGVRPDIVTDQTSAHDSLNGYVPEGMALEEALALRKSNPKRYIEKSMKSMAKHVKAMLAFQKKGAIVFDYGNNIRQQAFQAGVKNAYDFQGFVPLYIRPMFCEGRGPFRWIAVSGNKDDIAQTDAIVMREFAKNKQLVNWIKLAQEKVPFEGLPARVCWLGYGERAKFGRIINTMVAEGKITAPIVITRDHLDCGSVASPFRETEKMMDGSDAVADWPFLNALINCAAGADLVAVHNGGGVGIGYSQHAGMQVVADGTEETFSRIERVLTTDPGMGVVRHVDAGYPEARRFARAARVKIPMMR